MRQMDHGIDRVMRCLWSFTMPHRSCAGIRVKRADLHTTTLFGDNQSALALAKDHQYHAQMKHLLRREKKSAQVSSNDAPPPPPPKDGKQPQHTSDNLDLTTTWTTPPRPTPPARPRKSLEPPLVLDPAQKAWKRKEAERLREREEKEAAKAEAERQAWLKKEKEDMLRQEEEEAERRRILVQEEVRQANADRLRKSKDMREAEERRWLELAEKRRIEKERRMEEAKLLEEWRKAQADMADALLKQKEHDRQRADAERRARIASRAALAKATPNAESCASGWVTIQTNESLSWKRRFFKLVGTTMFLYRSSEVSFIFLFLAALSSRSQDMTVVMDSVQLRHRVAGLKEWYEGFEELEAIAHSFAIQFKDGQGTWSVFSDSEEEKVGHNLRPPFHTQHLHSYQEILLGILYQAAGLSFG